MSYLGIDYGHGTTNRDVATGIRYGVISQHTVGQAWYDKAEADYGEPTCPKCGNKATTDFDRDDRDDCAEKDFEISEHACADFICVPCRYVFDSQEAFGDEPQGYSYSGYGYKLTDCLDNDIFVLKSPYYTFAPFCSPCVPGAGNLDSATPDGVKTYCLGHEWFEEGEAPYPVFSVKTGEEIHPSK